MHKILSIIVILTIVSCEKISDENALKPPFTDIKECIKYVNKLDAKRGYPKRKEESVKRECQNSSNLMSSD
jgi:hypothetical protein